MRSASIAVLLLALAGGCAKKKSEDKCARVIAKSMRVLGEIAALRGATLGDEEQQHLVEQCRKAAKAGRPDPQIDCVLAAADDAGVRDCYMKGYEQYLERSKEVEAKLQLGRLGKLARSAFEAGAKFPEGKVGPTPATPCCGEPAKQCTPAEAMWTDPVWQALGFSVEGAFHFQYSYESDGKTFTATATGDVGCTGKPTTHTLTGKVGADGTPELSQPEATDGR